MLTSQIENKQKLNFLDYKQPVNVLENDFRTSSYTGHRYFKQNDYIVPPEKSIISPAYLLHQKEKRYDYASEKASQYTPKYNFDQTNKAHLYMCCSRPTFVKSMEHCIFSRPPKPSSASASHHRDYAHRPEIRNDYVVLNKMSCVGQLSRNPDVGDVGGCYKYDSTKMNSYKAIHGDNIPPGCNKDTITVWNFIPTPKYREFDKRQKIVGNRSSFLKHKGMKSENQSAFTVPIPKKIVSLI